MEGIARWYERLRVEVWRKGKGVGVGAMCGEGKGGGRESVAERGCEAGGGERET